MVGCEVERKKRAPLLSVQNIAVACATCCTLCEAVIKAPLALLFLARTAMGFQFQAIGAVAPLLVADLAIDFALLGALIGIWMLPGVAVAIPGGLLGKRFGDKQVVCAGLALMAAGSFVTAAASDYAWALSRRWSRTGSTSAASLPR